VADNAEYEDRGYAIELAVCHKIRHYLTNVFSSMDPSPLVQCWVNGNTAPPSIACDVAVHRNNFNEVKALIRSELRVVEQTDDTTDLTIEWQVVIPGILKERLERTPELFRLTIRGIEGLNEPDVETTLPFHKGNSVNPNFGRPAEEIDHVILLVHGIRDIGAWQKKVSSQLVQAGTTIEQVRYGLYPLIRFLCPINLSNVAVGRVLKQLRDLKVQYPKAKVSVIAHSFGTYVTLKALERGTELKIWKLVFCGSVADDQYQFQSIAHRIGEGIGEGKRPTRDFILNDCGTGDALPVIGAAFGFFYGMAGATGFLEGFVTNRFHRAIDGRKGGHGLYFHPNFVKAYWRPFLIEDIAPVDGDGEQGEHLCWPVKLLYHGWVRLLCKVLAICVWSLCLLIALWGFWRLSGQVGPWHF
jgi:hypothetical protein